MRGFLVACSLVVVGCTSNERPQCHAALTHYYAAGCAISNFDETDAENECTSDGDGEQGNACQGPFDAVIACLNNTPDPVSSSAQCTCSEDWESAFDLCET